MEAHTTNTSPWSFFKNVYVVSLKEATERRDYIRHTLDAIPGLSYTIVDAVNGRKNPHVRQSYRDRGIIDDYGHGEGVLGCLASHRMLWERILYECNSAEPAWTLILEDDAKFHPLLTSELLSEYLGSIPKDAWMIKLGYLGTSPYSSKYVPVNKYWTSLQNSTAFSTICYAVRSDVVPHLLKHKWTTPVDHLRIPRSYGMINVEEVLEVPTDVAFRKCMNHTIGCEELYHGIVADQGFESQITITPRDVPVIHKIVYINSDKRVDQRIEMEKELTRMQVTAERFSAIDTIPETVGRTLSHIAVLKNAISEGLDHILILEDDFQFAVDRPTFDRQLYQLLSSNIPYDIITFSQNRSGSHPYNTLVSYARDTQTATGYLVNKRCYSMLLENFEEGLSPLAKGGSPTQYAIDAYWNSLQSSLHWFCFNVQMGIKRRG
jgi:GR25 family glycosyltransferase involved in LPS biosynthesis